MPASTERAARIGRTSDALPAFPADAGRMNVIEVNNLVKRYGDRAAVDDVSFTVEEGEIFGILGPNGAGKTTTVESIAGLRRPTAGTITVLGLDPRRDRAELRQQRRRPAPGERAAGQLTVWEALDLYASSTRRPADRRRLLDELGLADKRDTAVRQALRRPEAAALDRARPGRQPADRDPRRADHRPRPAGPPRHLGADRGGPRPRRHGPARHPLHGGGRAALRPDRGHRRAAGWSPSTRPPGIVAPVDAEQRLRFRPSAPFDDALLTGLPEVRSVDAGAARPSWSPAPATSSTPSPRCSPATRSSPTTCGSSRPPRRRVRRADRPQARPS